MQICEGENLWQKQTRSLTGVNGPDEDRVPEEAESEPQSNEGDGEVFMSAISSRPQSISSSSMGTSRGCHSCASGLNGMLPESSMDTSKHIDDFLTSSPGVPTDEGYADGTSFLLNTAEGTTGDEREIEDSCDVEETVMALVVPLGVVRVKIPGIAHLSTGRLFNGDFASSFISSCSCVCILMTSSDGL
jgi:hypothetical protein